MAIRSRFAKLPFFLGSIANPPRQRANLEVNPTLHARIWDRFKDSDQIKSVAANRISHKKEAIQLCEPNASLRHELPQYNLNHLCPPPTINVDMYHVISLSFGQAIYLHEMFLCGKTFR